MKKEELRRVQGVYTSHSDLEEAIESLHEEGYVNEEMCLAVKEGHEAYSELKAYPIESFEVKVENQTQSFFEKLKDLVLVPEEKEGEDISLKDLGLEETAAERFSPSLEKDSILLLVDSVAPRTPRHYYK